MPTPKKTDYEQFRVTRRERARVARLALRLGKSKTEALNLAVIHLLGTLERDQAVWMTVPGEPQEEPEEEQA